MASNPGLLITKLSNARQIIEDKKQEYPEDKYTHLIKSLGGLISAVTKVDGQFSGGNLTEKQKNKYTESLKRIAVNIAHFGNKWDLKDLNDAPAIVGTDPTVDLSALEIKMLGKLQGGQKLLDLLGNPNVPPGKKISSREEARVALDAVRRREKVEEVNHTIDRTGKKALKQNKGEIDVLTETEIIEVKGSAQYAKMDQPDSELKGQVTKYIQKINKDATANPFIPSRKIVVHLTKGASKGVIDWFAFKTTESGIIIEVRIGQR